MQKRVPFSMAIESRYPEQIAVLIARTPDGRHNPMTLGWFMPASMKPPRLAVAVGRNRYTLEAVRHAGEFTVSFLAEPQSELARHFGTRSGRDGDKFAGITCPTAPASSIDSLIITAAVANFECRVDREIEAGDHVIFIADVVCAHVTDNPVNRMFTLTNSEHLDGVRQRNI